jgi:signal transduction histidine kinase
VEGVGLTAFKKVSEYVICLILLAALVALYRHRRRFDRMVQRLLVASIVTTIAAELAFTFYVGVYDLSNVVGHLFKIVSFYLVYKAIIETGLTRPFDLLFRDLKQSEAALRRRTAELEARNEELDAYAHTVAHDLKNPLAVMIGFAQVLEEAPGALPEEELRRHLRRIVATGRKMREIVDGLLLLAAVRKVEEVTIEPLDMGCIVDEVTMRLADLIEMRKAEILTPAQWPRALGYAPWVEEVWANYISNAIKYGGQPPRIELGAAVQVKDDPTGAGGKKMVRFWVKDNGAGVAPEERDRLFRPFSQLEGTRSRGHGLGLSIVQRIVTRLHGQVDVQSQVGQGSVFSFTLPPESHIDGTGSDA